MIKVANDAMEAFGEREIPLQVAVMGCVVNGPGEARDADIGIAAGNKRGHLFIKGQNVAVVPEDEMVGQLVEWAEFINEHGIDAALERADLDKARREAEKDRAKLLDEQGDDANNAEREDRPDPQEVAHRVSDTGIIRCQTCVSARPVPGGQLCADPEVTEEERPLVEPLAAQPPRDLVVRLAGVARAARRHDVVERVAPAARQRLDAVALHEAIRGSAIGATAPGILERVPLCRREVVLDPVHAPLAPSGRPRPSRPIDRHDDDATRATTRTG